MRLVLPRFAADWGCLGGTRSRVAASRVSFSPRAIVRGVARDIRGVARDNGQVMFLVRHDSQARSRLTRRAAPNACAAAPSGGGGRCASRLVPMASRAQRPMGAGWRWLPTDGNAAGGAFGAGKGFGYGILVSGLSAFVRRRSARVEGTVSYSPCIPPGQFRGRRQPSTSLSDQRPLGCPCRRVASQPSNWLRAPRYSVPVSRHRRLRC